MRCSKCGTENREGRKFCVQCGQALKLACPSCGAPSEPGERFCGDCGAALVTAQPSAVRSPTLASASSEIRITPEQTDASLAIDGERRTVTALFADIKGSMELMEDLDPEEARAIVDPALKLMMDAVHRYGGYVAQSTGDGIFALFGAPIAHEDHPQRALYAALRMQEEVKHYAERLRAEKGVNLQVRVGVNTGEVVVRSIKTGEGQTEYTPIGHSISLASRLQTLAAPGSTAISEAMRKLVDGYFALRSLGPARIKGVAEAVNVYEVAGLGPLRTRLQRAIGRGLTKFVGREREMESLKHAAEQVKAGRGQIVAAMAEPGVGKSRLFYEFNVKNQSGWMVLEAFSVSHGKATAYLPVLELLRDYCRIGADDDARTRREKVTGRILTLDRGLEDTLPYVFALLGLIEGDDSAAQMDAQVRRRRTHEAIKRILLRESLNQPLMLIFEDLHWIDGETQALLNLLADSIGTAKVLLLVNYRPEYTHQWGNKTYYTQLRLDPLGRESTAQMLSTLLGEGAQLIALKRLVLERTEGNPFFMEELVQALFDEGVLVRDGAVKVTRALGQLKIPTTVQGILAARIDRLSMAEKDLLQILAVIGSEFSLQVVRRLTDKPSDEVDRILGDLQLGEFIYEQPAVGDIEYTFKHALTQEVAYNSLLLERRKQLHERAGRAIEAIHSTRLDDHLSDLARHYKRSGNSGKALEYLQRAGEQALARSIHTEALGLLTSALELLKMLPETPERMQRELALQVSLGSTLTALKGWSNLGVGQALDRASELCRQVGSIPRLFAVLAAQLVFCFARGETRRAYALQQQLLAIAKEKPDATFLLWAHCFGLILCPMGEFASARSDLESAVSLYETERAEEYRTVYPNVDPGVVALGWLAITLCLLGYPDQALERSRQALALARKLARPFNLAFALGRSAQFHLLRREGEACLANADESLLLATEYGLEQVSTWAAAHRARALIELGRFEEGTVQLKEDLAVLRASDWALHLTAFLGALGDGYGKIGRVAEGLAAATEGLAVSEKNSDRWFNAELYRVRGELLLKHDAHAEPKAEDEAESCFRQALEVARAQEVRWWELRTTVSLARLLAKQGRRNEARTMLADIFGWFTEGFDTADLKDAKALLDELSA
jgi:class 3 adenylate cyclase/tetratricopeptide (TPR) repeat protein